MLKDGEGQGFKGSRVQRVKERRGAGEARGEARGEGARSRPKQAPKRTRPGAGRTKCGAGGRPTEPSRAKPSRATTDGRTVRPPLSASLELPSRPCSHAHPPPHPVRAPALAPALALALALALAPPGPRRKPRGFAFVEFYSPDDAEEARVKLDKTDVHGREIQVMFAQNRRKRPEEMSNMDR